LFKTQPYPYLYNINSETDPVKQKLFGNVELTGAKMGRLNMMDNIKEGYEIDLSVNCDSTDGSLVQSPGKRVYRKSVGKSILGTG
jgi:hypothetical protein